MVMQLFGPKQVDSGAGGLMSFVGAVAESSVFQKAAGDQEPVGDL